MKTSTSHLDIGLSVPFNLDEKVIHKFAEINSHPARKYPIKSVYYGFKMTLTGTGRTPYITADTTISRKDIVRLLHSYGFEAFETFNAPDLGGAEWSEEFRQKLKKEILACEADGVDGIILAIPQVMTWVRQWAPKLKISNSVANHINSVDRAEQLLNYAPIDRLYLGPAMARNFRLIREVRKRFPHMPIIILATESCLHDCVLNLSHIAFSAHSSRESTALKAPDSFLMLCGRHKLENNINVLKASFLRPEDLKYAFEAGVNYIKLSGRTMDSERLIEMVKAYTRGSFDGDIWKFIEKSGITSPEWEKMLNKKLAPCRYEVDNKALDGFIDFFVKHTPPCIKNLGCAACTYCHGWLKAVKIPANRDERIKDLKELFDIVKNEQWNIHR